MATAPPSADTRTDPRETSSAATSDPVARGPRLFPASAKAVLLNYCSAASLLLLGYAFYLAFPYYQNFFSPAGYTALGCVLAAYLVLLPLYYATFPDTYDVKCRLVWRALLHLPRRRPSAPEGVALRAVFLKAFYLPLMINWLFLHIAAMSAAGEALWSSPRPLQDGYLMAFSFLFVIDIVCFTAGYAIEHPRLGNEIRSVEPTLLGWGVALACYPPFAQLTVKAFGWYTNDYPEFGSPMVQVVAAVVMLVLVGIYSWASWALGFKASNLTHRGIVHRGPYAWVRHPAYASKNLFWALGALPWLLDRAVTEPVLFLYGVYGLAGWACLYYVRAVTEEDHLSQDPAYRDYCRRVPYRFIPGVW